MQIHIIISLQLLNYIPVVIILFSIYLYIKFNIKIIIQQNPQIGTILSNLLFLQKYSNMFRNCIQCALKQTGKSIVVCRALTTVHSPVFAYSYIIELKNRGIQSARKVGYNLFIQKRFEGERPNTMAVCNQKVINHNLGI